MNLQYLRYAVEVERTGSITQAAQNLYMAQPNLSKAIKDLESELGYAVFERTTSGVTPTELGYHFLFYARRVVAELEAIDQIAIPAGKERIEYKLSVPRGTYLAIAYTDFIESLDKDKDLNIMIKETNAQETITYVANRGANLGIIRIQKNMADNYFKYLTANNLSYKLIWDFEMSVAMSREHPLAKKKNLTADDLVGYTKITHGDFKLPEMKGSHKLTTAEPYANADRTIYVYERGSQYELLNTLKDSYMWASAIPERYAGYFNLVLRKCKAENNRYLDLAIRRKNQPVTDLDIKLMEEIRRVKDAVAAIEIT